METAEEKKVVVERPTEFNFLQKERMYHMITESDKRFVADEDKKGEKTGGGMVNGKALITGWSRENYKKGDVFYINGDKYEVQKVKRRDHSGTFSDPKLAVNGFFEAECTFIRPVPPPKDWKPAKKK